MKYFRNVRNLLIVPKTEGPHTTNEIENSPPKPKKTKTARDPNSKFSGTNCKLHE